jgi:hypothetical protein
MYDDAPWQDTGCAGGAGAGALGAPPRGMKVTVRNTTVHSLTLLLLLLLLR